MIEEYSYKEDISRDRLKFKGNVVYMEVYDDYM